MAGRWSIRSDLGAGITVALVAVPQCMAFAAMSGLPPSMGIYTAVVMGLVGAAVAGSSTLIIGPAATISAMVLAVLTTAAPGDPTRWPQIASVLAVLVGLFTLIGALLNIGQFVRFVSRSVLIGLTVGAAILIFGTQLAPMLGFGPIHRSTLAATIWTTGGQLGQAHGWSVVMGAGTLALVLAGLRWAPRAPIPFLAVGLGGVMAWWMGVGGNGAALDSIGEFPRVWPQFTTSLLDAPFGTDLIVGAAAISLVGIIQTMAIVKTLALRHDSPVNPKRDLTALGAANLAAGYLAGFPGAGSFARSALNDMAGARSRWSGVVCALVIGVMILAAGPWTQYITRPAIAGLVMATAYSIVDWRQLWELLSRDRHDRIVLGATIGGVLLLPIHWAMLIGLALSIAIFLRRASQLHLVEMVGDSDQQFHERPIDERTGSNQITMLQIEGPLFFAHADELAERLGLVFDKHPSVTIVRMRRTQQIDFSVIVTLERVVRKYTEAGGHFLICGLTQSMFDVLRNSTLGRIVASDRMLQTTGEVFGSAHRALRLAEELCGVPLLLSSADPASVP